jgi:hypothetical protein
MALHRKREEGKPSEKLEKERLRMRELLRWDGSAYAGVAMLVLVLFGTKSHD